MTFWSQRISKHATNRRELSHRPFLPIRSLRRKRLIMINDLIAGMLPPESPKYASMKGKVSRAATCEGLRKIVILCNILYGTACMINMNMLNKNMENNPK